MTLTARKPHWKIGQAQAEPGEDGVPRPDPDAKRWGCFADSDDAAAWLADQLAQRPVAHFGTIDDAVDAFAFVGRQAGRDEDEEVAAVFAQGGFWRLNFEFGGIEYRMEVCTCTGDVTGRCHNEGCDREADYDSEPGGDYPIYTRWSHDCYRCWYPEYATGGFTDSNRSKPIPAHQHEEGTAKVARLIEGDEWTGWRCIGDEDAQGGMPACGERWRFADADGWASTHRLTRKWGGQVTGTEGYLRGTDADAEFQAQRLTDRADVRGYGYTVGWERIDDTEEDSK